MKKTILLALALGAAMLTAACGQPVKQGEVGVKVIEVGGNAGVVANELGTGRYWNGIGGDAPLVGRTFDQDGRFR